LSLDGPNLEFFVLIFFISSAIQGATASLSVGSLDIILVNVFILYGISAPDSGLAVIALRAATYWFPLLLSYAVIQAYGVQNILSGRSRENVSSVSTPDKDGQTWQSGSECFATNRSKSKCLSGETRTGN